MTHAGRFAGPIVGLRYETPTCSGVTDENGVFEYRDHEVVVFSVGAVVLGAARGAERLTVADIVGPGRREDRQDRRSGPDQRRPIPADVGPRR